MRARVTVTLKPGILDPQGKAIEGALGAIGIDGVAEVRQGKVFDIALAGSDPEAARALLTRACDRLLANTVVENYEIVIAKAETAWPSGVAQAPPPVEEAVAADVTPSAAESAAEAAEMPAEGHP